MRSVFLKRLEMKTTALCKVIVFTVALIAVLQSLEAVGSEIVPASAPEDVLSPSPPCAGLRLPVIPGPDM